MSSSTLTLPNSDGDEARNWVSSSSISKTRTISESTGIENLPDDLVMEIIARSSTSSKSATRCKSVCKRWFNLIVTPTFVHRFLCLCRQPQENEPLGFIQQFDHLKRQGGHFVHGAARIFTRWKTPTRFSSSLSFLPCGDENAWILASFNDLLVCCPGMYDHGAYYICNPVTKNFLVVPPHPLFGREQKGTLENIHVAFICDPYYNVCNDNVVVNPEYAFKLVCIPASGTYINLVGIFSSETGKWSTLVMHGREPNCDIRRVVAFDGMVLWAYPWVRPTHLDGFDVGDPEIRVHEFAPLPSEDHRDYSCFVLYQGNLRMLSCMSLRYGCCFYVWELKERNWSLVHRVLYEQMVCKDKRFLEWLRREPPWGLTFHPSDGDIVYFRPMDQTTTLVLNMRTRIVEIVGEDDEQSHTTMPLYLQGVFPIVLPAWPTPLPHILPQMSS